MSLRSTDLNLLPVLQALLEHQSVSRASQILGMTQPAASNALRRLRLLFDDPLLFQVGRTMQLTPRAQALLPHLSGVCDGIETLLQSPTFDPSTAVRTFVVTTPDYIAFLLTADVLKTLRAKSPGVTVQFVDLRGDLSHHLHSDHDLAVVASDAIGAGIDRSRRLADRMVAVVHRDHPLTRTAVTLDALHAYPELRFRIGSHIGDRDFPTKLQTGSQVCIAVEQFSLLPLLTTLSDCVALVPRSLGRYFGELLPIAVLDLPGEGWEFDSYIFWSQGRNSDPAHRWFRSLIEDTLYRRFRPGRRDTAADPSST